jgi:hypothetical protein
MAEEITGIEDTAEAPASTEAEENTAVESIKESDDQKSDDAALTSGEEGKQADAKSDADAEAETVYDEFTMPNGVEVDEEAMAVFLPMIKEFDLDQGQAQRLVDMYTNQVVATAEAQRTAYEDRVSGWLDRGASDKEIGGDKADEALSLANKAMREFGSNSLKASMDETGVGNHPEMIRFMSRVGRAIGEDKIIPGDGMVGTKTRAEIMFPGQSAV